MSLSVLPFSFFQAFPRSLVWTVVSEETKQSLGCCPQKQKFPTVVAVLFDSVFHLVLTTHTLLWSLLMTNCCQAWLQRPSLDVAPHVCCLVL